MFINNWLQRRQSKRAWPTVDQFVGMRLAVFRTRLGYDHQQMATQIGVPAEELAKYEAGKRRLSASRLFELSKFFDVPVADFFRSDEEAA